MGFSKEEIRELEDPDWDLRTELARKLHLTTDEGDATPYQSLATLLLFVSSRRLERGTERLEAETRLLKPLTKRLKRLTSWLVEVTVGLIAIAALDIKFRLFSTA